MPCKHIFHCDCLYNWLKRVFNLFSIIHVLIVDNNYLKLFIELESLIENALKVDLHDRHSKMRGWTPPPKGYADTLAPDEEPDKTEG